MRTYYLVTIYELGKARYVRVNSLDEAIQICDRADFARIQKKDGWHSKYVYEKYNGVVTTY